MIDRTELHALADGELTPEESADLRRRIDASPTAKAELDAIHNLKDCLRQAAVTHTSEDCWRACIGRLDALDRARRVEGFVGKYAWALCAVFFVLILGGRMAVQNVRGDAARTADLGKVFTSLGASSPSPNAVARQQWLNQMLGEAKWAIDPNRIGIVGGARSLFHGVPITRLDLRDRSGPLALYVIPARVNFQDTAPVPDDPNMVAGAMVGRSAQNATGNCVIWRHSAMTLVLTGPRPVTSLAAAAHKICGTP